MTSNPYSDATAILDAAARGEAALGHDAVGALLVDLARTTPISHGEAVQSPAVGLAAAASAPGAMAGVAAMVKPGVILLGIGALAFAVGLSARPTGGPGTVTIAPPAGERTGVERVVSDPATSPPDSSTTSIDEVPAIDPDGPPEPAASGSSAGPATSVAVGSVPSSAPATSAGESTTTSSSPPSDPTTSTTTTTTVDGSPSTTTTSTTTTTVVTTTTEAHGNNGNGNNNGVGNGKGNQRNGNGNGGNGGNGNGNGNGNGGTDGGSTDG